MSWADNPPEVLVDTWLVVVCILAWPFAVAITGAAWRIGYLAGEVRYLTGLRERAQAQKGERDGA